MCPSTWRYALKKFQFNQIRNERPSAIITIGAGNIKQTLPDSYITQNLWFQVGIYALKNFNSIKLKMAGHRS